MINKHSNRTKFLKLKQVWVKYIEKSASLVESSTTKESKTENSKENLSEKKSDEKAGDPAAEGPERSREEVKVDLDDLDSKLDQILEKDQ